MGDQGGEPSMEDILSSIKRIIAEEGDPGAATRGRRIGRPFPTDRQPEPLVPPAIEQDDEPEAPRPAPVLELDQSLQSRTPPPPEPATPPVPEAKVQPQRPVEDVARPVPPAIDPAMLSPRVAEATRGQLEALSRMIVKPDVSGSDTLEGLVRDMLKPMLSQWLDTHLPSIVEAMVAREIARISGRSDS